MRPVLQRKTEIRIARLDREHTVLDPDFKTATAGEKKYLPAVVVLGQVAFDRVNAQQVTPAGNDPATTGRVVLSARDYQDAGGFSVGDKITMLGGVEVEAYLTEIKPAAFSRTAPGLYILQFESRQKTR